ncbi:hypothetical protein [Pseudomonas sp. C2B4]|uniref:hypothetical protein n=1 Tax=Pseudomonas sp. C2B4 TaxID=2735270 RepID=UPI001586C488|nr:hypothetical protein [Pseudomonas sp. C2B4]NUU36521.1 hypothetical protein [Pseudomonas sp. C2B4]
MMKLKKRITNPMTIIAIFATLSETSAAVSLPFLDNRDREIYVWFLISFPFYLLFLFFATLNFNYRSLYSPSDFEKDEHFLKAMDNIDPQENNASVDDSRPASSPGNAQAPPDKNDSRHLHSDQHHIHLPELMKDLHIVDARRMKNKTEFSTLLEKIPMTQEQQVILFLTGEKSDNQLKGRVLKYSKQTRKRGSANFCVAYNLSSHGVTVMNQGDPLTDIRQ